MTGFWTAPGDIKGTMKDAERWPDEKACSSAPMVYSTDLATRKVNFAGREVRSLFLHERVWVREAASIKRATVESPGSKFEALVFN